MEKCPHCGKEIVKKMTIWVAKGADVPVYHEGAENLNLDELGLLQDFVQELLDEKKGSE